MQVVKKSLAFTIAASFSLFLMGTGVVRMNAQQGGATIAGTVIDQANKAVEGASVVIKNGNDVAKVATTDAAGKFSATGLAAATYTIEVGAPGFALGTRRGVTVAGTETQNIAMTLNVDAISQSVTVQETIVLAADTAPQGNTLDTISAKTEISNAVITNFMAPVADFAEVIQQAPGAFSTNPNGIGLGQGKSFFRGFADGNYTLTFDGIPFEDTNSPTHHSWASFPSQWISSTDFDRSPGLPSNFGPANFGGSINLKSPELQADPDIRGTFTIASFNTKLYSIDFESGLLGPKKADAILFNINAMTSDGYQTYNKQQRDAGYGKYQHRFSPTASLSLYGGVVDIWNHTPNTTVPTRAQVAAYGDNFLQDGTPTCTTVTLNCPVANGSPDPYYYGYNNYHVQTDFEYAAYTAYFGNGWKIDTKAYTTRYWNKQYYQSGATVNLTPAKPSGVDKLNGYRHAGDTLVLSNENKWGVFRTGIWYDWAYTDRYQDPSNILTHENTPLPNFHEHFITTTTHPFAEFEWRATPKLVITVGIKAAAYGMYLNQYQDNGKTVGCLGGTLTTYPSTAGIWAGAPECIGGAAFVSHSVTYNTWLPTAAARYRIWKQWSAYAEYAEGSLIPLSSVFDTPGGNVLTPPKPQLAKTYQTGSVLKLNRFTLDADFFYIHYQNGYDSYTDPTTGEPVFVATGPSNTKGFELESHYVIGHGLSVYGNFTAGSAKYAKGPNFPNGGEWVANTPSNTEGLNILWQHGSFDIGYTFKRIGQYYQDNGSLTYKINGISEPYPVDQALAINPWTVSNAFFNYRIKNSSHFRGTKIQLAFNNIANSHALVGLNPGVSATATTPYVQSPLDQLNLLPGRSISLTITGGYAPKR
jgi:iron complex outermembrane receptor protein